MTAEPIVAFKGDHHFLSNFYPCPVRWEQIDYPSSEHAFNAGKSIDMGVRLWIAAAPTPREAKRRGHSIRLRPDWDKRVRYLVMAEVLAAKFRNPELARKLRATGDAPLIEGNTWCDNVWGLCMCGRPACDVDVRHTNWLGRLLMYLRDHGFVAQQAVEHVHSDSARPLAEFRSAL